MCLPLQLLRLFNVVLFRTIELEVLTGLILDQRDYLGIIPALCLVSVPHCIPCWSQRDVAMVEYLSSSLTAIEERYPGCGIFLTGDFNRLNINQLIAQFRLKQLVRVQTRGDLPLTKNGSRYNFRNQMRTKRFSNTFIQSMYKRWNSCM